MRIGSQSTESNIQKNLITSTVNAIKTEGVKVDTAKNPQVQASVQKVNTSQAATAKSEEERTDAISKEKVQVAVESINEFLDVQQKSSKFVFHDGLDQYYVRLVDAKTEEVIKEIPPQKLLDAFYEMQKLAGMIVDEKI